MTRPSPGSVLQFGSFLVDLDTQELRKDGRRVKIQHQPFQVLALLLRRHGTVITREEIQKELWSDDTFVDFEHGINYSINQIRSALGDSAETPRYVETLTRRGYRFKAPVEHVPTDECDCTSGSRQTRDLSGATRPEQGALSAPSPAPDRSEPARPGPLQARRRRAWMGAGAIGLALAAGYLAVSLRSNPSTEDAPASARKRIVVLPFENLGPPEDAYFASGMTDELTSRLAAVSALAVISRNSAHRYEKPRATTRQIGEELRVDYVLEGTVRWEKEGRVAGRVLVTPQLIRVSDDTHMWAGRYERELTDIFSVQAEIAEQVLEKLQVTLLEPETKAVDSRPMRSLEAYNAYLRGLDYWNRRRRDLGWSHAQQLFGRAAELDPGFAEAFVQLSEVHTYAYQQGLDRTEGRATLAKAAVERALAIAPDLPVAHLALANYYRRVLLDNDAAVAEVQIAAKGLPNDAVVFQRLAAVYLRQGKFEQALAESQKVLAGDPFGDGALLSAVASGMLRRYSDAERFWDEHLRFFPDDGEAYALKAQNQRLRGQLRSARATLERIPAGASHPFVPLTWFEQETAEGKYAEAVSRLEATTGERSAEGHEYFHFAWFFYPKSLLLALAHLWAGDAERARVEFRNAAAFLEKEMRTRPSDARLRSALGIAYAGLGRSEEAVREGKKAVELLPVSSDAVLGPSRIEDLAFIYTLAGEHGKALDTIDALLSIPAPFSTSLLELDPRWGPLRDNPRYREILIRHR